MEIGRLTAAIVAAAAFASAQPSPDLRAAEKVFKNVQSLKGISANEFMATMGFFTASLGESCTYCHLEESGGNWERIVKGAGVFRTCRRKIIVYGL